MAMLELTMYKTEMAGHEPRIQLGKIITFRVENTYYAVEAKYVRELICSAMVTHIKLDGVSRYCPMINIRGKLVNAYDMQKLTGRRRNNAPMIPNVLMIEQKTGGGKMAGLIVDSVEEVMHSGGQEWSESPGVSDYDDNRLIKAELLKNNRIIHLLNPEFLFDTEFVNRISSKQ